jgi:glutathionylspermidine synthase
MTDDVRAYYASMNIPINKMVVVGTTRRGLTAESIEMAAEQIYNDIQAGRDVRKIRIAWEVYSLAKQLRAQADAKEREEMRIMRTRLKWFEQPWYKRIFRRATS